MDRIWLKHYPAGVPAEIDAAQYASLVALFEESFAKYRDRKAFICMDKAITYGELDEMSRDFAAWLQSTGLKRGDRVAVMMPNVLQYPVAIAGILRAGYDGGERQPALHAARARAPAQGFRRRGDRHPGELRHHAGAGAQEHAREARRAGQHGRPARLPEGHDRQSGRAQGEEDGAGLFAARAPCSSTTRSRPASGKPLNTRDDHARRRRVPAVHRRHDRRVEGRDAAPPQHRRQRAAERRLAAAGAVRRSRRSTS